MSEHDCQLPADFFCSRRCAASSPVARIAISHLTDMAIAQHPNRKTPPTQLPADLVHEDKVPSGVGCRRWPEFVHFPSCFFFAPRAARHKALLALQGIKYTPRFGTYTGNNMFTIDQRNKEPKAASRATLIPPPNPSPDRARNEPKKV